MGRNEVINFLVALKNSLGLVLLKEKGLIGMFVK